VLEGKRILITGVATTDSIAFAVAQRTLELGGEIVLAAFPRDLEAASTAAAQLPGGAPRIIPADLTSEEDLDALTDALRDHWGRLDGALHAVAFAPQVALGGDLTRTPAGPVELAFRTSAWSYATLARVLADLAPEKGGSLVGLDFDGSAAWPTYNWMGVCKSALESTNRYLARDLGAQRIRTNLVAAGPIHTRAADAIPHFDRLLSAWANGAPIAWDEHDAYPTADATCFLLSDFARAITGEILHVDGGYHAMAAPLPR
jgi:meromycolic acid enoyl-[acyl-carrier-protein] reductase